MAFVILLSVIYVLFHILPDNALALQVQVGSGSVSTSQPATSCAQLQEFRCINDVCDACASSCRNGKTCAAGQLCDSQPGHCLENQWCTPGRHQMPDASVGKPKHFLCLSVTGLDPGKAMVIYQNSDFTGDSCLVDGNGVWASPNNELASSVDTTVTTGSFPICRRAGQPNADPNPVSINADAASLPGGDACPAVTLPNVVNIPPNVVAEFPFVNATYWYQDGAEDTEAEEVNGGGTKRRMQRGITKHYGDLERRGGNPFRESSAQVRETALLTGILLLIRQILNGQDMGGLELAGDTPPPEGGSWFSGNAFAADHILELQIITNFFNAPGNNDILNIFNWMQTCPDILTDVVSIINGQTNLIGIPSRINSVKGQLFRSYNPTWSNYFREEIQALQAYLNWANTGIFSLTVAHIADIMDTVYNAAQQVEPTPTSSNFVTPGVRFRRYCARELARVLAQVLTALQTATFKNSATFSSSFAKGSGGNP